MNLTDLQSVKETVIFPNKIHSLCDLHITFYYIAMSVWIWLIVQPDYPLSTTNALSIMPGRGFIQVCTSCSFSCSTRTMSPGSMFGAWSASPEKVIFWPCFMPLSTCTSRSLFSLHTFWPSHFLQRSFSLINSPTLGKGKDNVRILQCVNVSLTFVCSWVLSGTIDWLIVLSIP